MLCCNDPFRRLTSFFDFRPFKLARPLSEPLGDK